MQVAVTGASGLIGRALAAALRADGHRVVRLVRRPPAAADEIAWDPRAPGAGLDPRSLDGVAAVVHLAGAGIGDRPWTPRYRAEIRNSRVQGTTALVSALTAMPAPPGVMLSASAFGWYGDTGGREVTESAPPGRGFLADVVRDWEAAAAGVARAGTRVVMLRSGLVLSRDGGILGWLLPLFRLGLGARLGSGGQVMNWVALADWVAVARFLLDRGDIAGPVNVTAPHPVSNAEFTAALAAAVHRPALLAVPVPALRLAAGGASSELLSSARVMPHRLLAAGYEFAYPDITEALAAERSGVREPVSLPASSASLPGGAASAPAGPGERRSRWR